MSGVSDQSLDAGKSIERIALRRLFGLEANVCRYETVAEAGMPILDRPVR
jgi:hypothetical protein